MVKSWVILTRLKRRALRRRLISYLEIRSCEWLSRHWWLLRRALNWLSYVIQRIDYLVEPLTHMSKPPTELGGPASATVVEAIFPTV